MKKLSTLIFILSVGVSNLAAAKGANAIDEAITSKSHPFAKWEIKKIYAQCSGSYTLMYGVYTAGPFKDVPNSSIISDNYKSMNSFFVGNGKSMAGHDFDETAEIAYVKLRDYFNRNNFTKEGQLESLNEFKRISNICVDFSKKVER